MKWKILNSLAEDVLNQGKTCEQCQASFFEENFFVDNINASRVEFRRVCQECQSVMFIGTELNDPAVGDRYITRRPLEENDVSNLSKMLTQLKKNRLKK